MQPASRAGYSALGLDLKDVSAPRRHVEIKTTIQKIISGSIECRVADGIAELEIPAAQTLKGQPDEALALVRRIIHRHQ